MTDRSSITNLKNKLSKEKWEIKSLSEIAIEIIEGKEVTKDQLGSGDYPAIRYAEIFKSSIYIKECTSRVNPEIIKSLRHCKYGDLLISRVSENLQDAGKAAVYLGNETPIIGQAVFAIRHKENPKFLSYILGSAFVKDQFKSKTNGVTIINVTKSCLQRIKIPLPPRHIQDQIAEYLEKWTSLERQLEQELEQELEQRKKQYEYYKESLLNSGMNKWEIYSLDKIATEIISGHEISKHQSNTGDYPAIRYSDVFDNLIYITSCKNFIDTKLISNPSFCDFGDILIAIASNVRDNIGKSVVYLGNERPAVGKSIEILKHHQNGKFLSYMFSSRLIREQIKTESKVGTVINLNKSCLRRIKIPLPSLEEQSQIVEILDKFHTITESFKDGLPSLIEKHRKQYDYYKEQILNPEITA